LNSQAFFGQDFGLLACFDSCKALYTDYGGRPWRLNNFDERRQSDVQKLLADKPSKWHKSKHRGELKILELAIKNPELCSDNL
jgi:hypothetical protein